ncbi:hypothetical protein ACIQAA_19255 [Neobacillus sp. NPDC093182]|uniref:hypothetical protein n=1 Tax=Neobacillus sp. NPDC093182 TaxID=3364297 RepID=UPI003801B260
MQAILFISHLKEIATFTLNKRAVLKRTALAEILLVLAKENSKVHLYYRPTITFSPALLNGFFAIKDHGDKWISLMKRVSEFDERNEKTTKKED